MNSEQYRRVEAAIDLDAIRSNIITVRNLNPKSEGGYKKVLAVIKADAYGHGAVEVAKAVDDLADYYGVACIDEAVELRQHDITKPILILGYTDSSYFEDLISFDVTTAIYSLEDAKLLSAKAEELGKPAKVHIKVDSGMSRIGFQCTDEELEKAIAITKLPGIVVDGIFTHYAKADYFVKDDAKTQYEKFSWFVRGMEEAGVTFNVRHIDNSAGAMEIHSEGFDMIRLGIVIYGLYPSEEIDKSVKITPAMTFKSRIIHVKDLEAGRGVGYGWTYVTEGTRRIATISVGYADGYPRALSNIGRVIINGEFAPITGRVCMDQIMVDVTDIKSAEVGDEVILFGSQGGLTIPVEEVAEPANSFNYEAVCNIARRVPRVYIRQGKVVNEVNYIR